MSIFFPILFTLIFVISGILSQDCIYVRNCYSSRCELMNGLMLLGFTGSLFTWVIWLTQ